jgi:phage-related protein
MDIIDKGKANRKLEFIGDSREMICSFPQTVKRRVGYAIRFAQASLKHEHAKPLKGLGPGTFEIVEDFSGDTYRAVYTVRLKHAIYVLHAFQKKSKKGIKTPKKEMDLIKARFKIAQEIDDER